MVSYSDWTSIAFEIARDDVGQNRVIQRAAEVWNQNKQALQSASKSEARDMGRRLL